MSGSSLFFALCLAALFPTLGWADNGRDDAEGLPCVTKKSFFAIHFAAYQARDGVGQQFAKHCQDVPQTGKTTLVFDLMHHKLREMLVAVRVVESTEGAESETLLSVPPQTYASGVVTVEARFDKPGAYTAIVSLEDPGEGKAQAHGVDTLSFPLRVGMTQDSFAALELGMLGPWLVILSLAGIGSTIYYYLGRRKQRGRDAPAGRLYKNIGYAR